MKLKVIVTLAATSLGAAALLAQPQTALGKNPPAATSPRSAGAVMPKTVALPPPEGTKWGLSLEQLSKLYDKEVEKEFKPRFLKAGNSPEVLVIEDEMKLKQGVLRRSRVAFDDVPTGIDQSALKGEYSYGNGESLARVMPPAPTKAKPAGTARHFFFFNDKLWKVYDEHPLGPGSKIGETYEQALKKLAMVFGVAPQKVPADYAKGQSFDEAVWRDGDKVIRAVDRGNILGMVYADKSIHDNLAKYRTKKVADQHVLDKDVASATASPPSQISGPKDAEKDKKGAAKKDAKKP